MSKNVANSGLPGLFNENGRQGKGLKVSGRLEGMEITVVVGGRTESEEVNDIIVHLQCRRVRPMLDRQSGRRHTWVGRHSATEYDVRIPKKLCITQ